MIKNEAEWKLEIGLASLEEEIKQLDSELLGLDPYAGWAARLQLAKIKGTVEYMKGGLSE